MKKIALFFLSLLVSAGILLTGASPVLADGRPPQNPEIQWQPSGDESCTMAPAAEVVAYQYNWSNLELLPPSPVAPGTAASIIYAGLVNEQGTLVSTLSGRESCYLIVSFNGPGYFYLYEYYPSGKDPYGQWLCYRWYRPGAGIWKIGPFSARPSDPEGPYTWKMWFLSDGPYWSTRTASFYYLKQPDQPVSNTVTVSVSPACVSQAAPQPAAQPVISSFRVDDADIEKGQSTTLRWTTVDAISAKIEPEPGSVAGSGSTAVNPAGTTTYTLTANGKSGSSVASAVTVGVKDRVQPVIRAGNASINVGETSTLFWEAPGAASVSLVGRTGLAESGSLQVSPERTATYTMNALYHDGTSVQASVTLEVKQPPYLLISLIVLLATASLLIVVLLIYNYPAPKQSACTCSTAQAVPDTKPAQEVPVTSTLTVASPAWLVMPDGSEMLLAGNNRVLGRQDLERFLQKDTASYISRNHFSVGHSGGDYFIEDCNSTNGTKINGVDIRGQGKHKLEDGDEIELACKLIIRFRK